jgi:uncharacterized repeat protein (TIGR01451 family)
MAAHTYLTVQTMPISSLSKRFFQRTGRWQRLAALVLVGVLSHPVASVCAQIPDVINEATATYTTTDGPIGITSNTIVTRLDPALIDPGGNLLGCNGQPLASYAGFSMGLYEPDASGLDLGSLVALTPTLGTDSISPNTNNNNPFSLLPNEGRYNFLFDSASRLTSPLNAGLKQTDSGAQYILAIRSPEGSRFSERRVRIEMLGVSQNTPNSTAVLSYRATSLDGQPISADGATQLTKTVEIRNAAVQSLTFFEFGLNTVICEAEQVKLTKSADRSAAQPGDVVVYRLNIQNLAKVEVDTVVAIDTLPLGFELVDGSVTGQVNGNTVAVKSTLSGRNVTFSVGEALGSERSLDIIYATRLTPDALRGTGRNSAVVTAERTDTGYRIQDGPSSHLITLDPGLLSDCGTLIGRVFEDKNFDGEQQPGEAGIPNAVIFLDDGNRVVTDADGLYSVQKMLPGQRTGTLDLSSLPGYTLAANLRFSERNSLSRLVNLAPGGLVRMNFGVTPTFQEAQE